MGSEPRPTLFKLKCGDVHPHPGAIARGASQCHGLRMQWHTVAEWQVDVVFLSENPLDGGHLASDVCPGGNLGLAAFLRHACEILAGGGAASLMLAAGGVGILVPQRQRGCPARHVLPPTGFPLG